MEQATFAIFDFRFSTNISPVSQLGGPMTNLMVALTNIGGALYSTPQSLADAHY